MHSACPVSKTDSTRVCWGFAFAVKDERRSSLVRDELRVKVLGEGEHQKVLGLIPEHTWLLVGCVREATSQCFSLCLL